MRRPNPLVTVGVVARSEIAGASPRGSWAPGCPLWLTVAVIGLCATLVTLGVSYPHERGQRLLVAFVVCSPIAALRRWPLPVLAVAAAANAMVMVGGDAPLPLAIVLGLASYLLASRLPRRVSIPAAAAAAAGIGAALVYAAVTARNAPAGGGAVEGFLAAGWFIGDSTAARRRYLAGLAEQD